MAELKYWIWMNETGIRPYTCHQLLDYFGGPKEVFFAEREDLRKVPDLSVRDLNTLCNKELDHVYRIGDDMAAAKGRIITIQDAEYPERLRNIADPPLILYIRGTLPVIDDEAAIGIVGTRKCSTYGISAAQKIAEDIAMHGGLVVTGMADGIDAAAARGALKGGGHVVGVLGTGIERVYPAHKESVQLFEDVLEQGGCLLSEYPPGSEPLPFHFPRRNRIITGLSVALVALEIPSDKSGTMLSVNLALEQSRDVFLVPANIDSPTSRMSNQLITEGLSAITEGWQALIDLESRYPKIKRISEAMPALRNEALLENPLALPLKKSVKKAPLEKKVIDTKEKEVYIELDTLLKGRSDTEVIILKALDNTPIHVDEIIGRTNLPAQKVSVCLTTLQIAGSITAFPGKLYAYTANVKK